MKSRAGELDIDAVVVEGVPDLGEVVRIGRETGAGGVCAACEASCEAAAQGAEELGLPGPGPEAARCIRHKGELRSVLAAAGLAGPRFSLPRSPQEAEAQGRRLGLPVIVKPVDASGSQGVMRVDHLEDMPLAYARASRCSPSGTVLLEEWLPGEAYHVHGVVESGRFTPCAISAHELSTPPYCCDWGVSLPTRFNRRERELLFGAAEAVVDAIGLRLGVVHIELVMGENGPGVIELGLCPSAGHAATQLMSLAGGPDLLSEAIRLAVGELPGGLTAPEGGAAQYWLRSHSGIVTDVTGVEEARAIPGVVAVEIGVKPGDVLRHAVDAATRNRVGYVIAAAGNAVDAAAVAKAARECCRIETASSSDDAARSSSG